MQKGKLIIYTDGAARGNPGKGGWGAVILKCESPVKKPGPEIKRKSDKPKKQEKVAELGGRSNHATNNQMELTAAIESLKHVKDTQLPVEIYSDSKYVILGITEWINGWLKNNWRNAAKKPVLNKDLWKELHALYQEIKPTLFYVEGHSGDKYNERADEIATSFADNDPVDLKKT